MNLNEENVKEEMHFKFEFKFKFKSDVIKLPNNTAPIKRICFLFEQKTRSDAKLSESKGYA